MKLHGLLLAPALGAILAFMILPIGITTLHPVLTPAQYGGVIWQPSGEAYARLVFERDIFDATLAFNADCLRILWRSVAEAGVATALCLVIGLPTAWFIAARPPAQKSQWPTLVTVRCWVNLLVRTIALLLILRDEGPITQALQALGPSALTLACISFAIGLGLVSSFLPFMILALRRHRAL